MDFPTYKSYGYVAINGKNWRKMNCISRPW